MFLSQSTTFYSLSLNKKENILKTIFFLGIFPVLLGAIVALIGVSVFSCYKAYSYKLQMRQGSNQDQYGLVHSATDSDDEDEHEHDNGNMRRPNGIVKEYHDNYENDENEDSV